MATQRYNWREDPYFGLNPPTDKGASPNITFGFLEVDEARRGFLGEVIGNRYARIIPHGNPTTQEFEEMVARAYTFSDDKLDTFANPTGMSSIDTIVQELATRDESRREIVSSYDLYGGTNGLFEKIMRRRHVKWKIVENQDSLDEWERAISLKTGCVLCELVSNPLGKLPDIVPIAQITHRNGAQFIVDNTILSPILFNPFKYGADWVVDSASKIIEGRSRHLGGLLTGRQKPMWEIKKFWGALTGPIMDWYVASEMMETFLTLSDRAPRQSANALTLARYLQKKAMVKKVHYSLLSDSPYFHLAKKYNLSGGGPMLSFEIKGSRKNAVAFIESLRIVIPTTHLGHYETLATPCADTTHVNVPESIREKSGIMPTLIRLSAGCEDGQKFKNVLEDINQALKRASGM